MIPLSAQLTGSAGRTGIAPAHLLEVQDVNGKSYAWADRVISAPSVLNPGMTLNFVDWLIEVPKLSFYRSLKTATGQFVIQNLSGNTLQRDMEVLIRSSALEGAQFVYRMWQAASEDSWRTWTGTLNSATPGEQIVTINARDQWDANSMPAHDRQACEACPWLWGSLRCGVTIVPPDDGDELVLIRTDPPTLTAPLGLTGTAGASTRPDYIPTPIPIGNPGGGGPGDPGNPGPGPGGGNGTVSSSTECFYSYESCQVTERFGGLLNSFETNYGESLARMVGPVQTRQRRV